MRKICYFQDFPYEEWPDPIAIRPFFSPDKWTSGGDDSWDFRLIQSDGIEGTPWGNGPSRANLTMTGIPHFGVTLQYDRWTKSTRQRECYNSRGDLSKTLEFVRNLHDDQFSLGLFVSFDQAWIAAKEFLESDGALPPGVPWIDSRALPPGAFPLP